MTYCVKMQMEYMEIDHPRYPIRQRLRDTFDLLHTVVNFAWDNETFASVVFGFDKGGF